MENKKRNRYESMSQVKNRTGKRRGTGRKYRKRNRGIRIEKKQIQFVLGLICAALFAIYVNGVVYYTSHFLKGTVINGIDVSKMTVEKIDHTIADYEMKISERGIDGNGVYIETLSAKDIDMKVVSDSGLEQLVKEQNQFLWFIKEGSKHEEQRLIDYDEKKLEEQVKNLKGFQAEYAKKPTDAAISEYKDGYTIIEATQGNYLNKKKTIACLESAISNLVESVDLDQKNCYQVPKVPTDDERIVNLAEQMNQYVGTTITYNFGETQEIIDGNMISQWLIVEDFQAVIDKNKVDGFVETIRKKYDTIFSNREFKTSYGQTVKVEGGDYGWWLNTPRESKELMEMLASGTSGERKPAYYQEAASHKEKDYGDSYVEINLTAQHLFVYKDGQNVLDTDFVSGNISTKHGTNTGTFGITYKERYSELIGETYESTVSYWMPFDEDIGMHDAIWKKEFGQDFYKKDGSHGCINLPYLTAKKIYSLVEKGMPVIVYDLPGTESTSVTNQGAQEIAQAAIEAIDAIGKVTKHSEESIKDARYMYNKVGSEARKYVTNYDVLEAAEEKFKEYK